MRLAHAQRRSLGTARLEQKGRRAACCTLAARIEQAQSVLKLVAEQNTTIHDYLAAVDDMAHYDEAEELYVDKEGIPHWDGENVALLREYRMRVAVEYSSQSVTTELGKEKRANLGLRLTRGLTGRAWRAVEPLLQNMEALSKDGGHTLIIDALEALDKVAVARKQQKFDDFFKRSRRRRGQEIIEYLRTFHNKYKKLRELDKDTRLSDDLYAYFMLEGAQLTDDQKRLVTMVADNRYETRSFENTLKTNYHDIHLMEQRARATAAGIRPLGHRLPKGKGKSKGTKSKVCYVEPDGEEYDEYEYVETYDSADDLALEAEDYAEHEDEEVRSDVGASEDESISVAYAAYDAARSKVRDLQRRRGYFRAEGTLTFEERQAAITKEKSRTACAACGQTGHWAGDPECPRGPSSKDRTPPTRKGAGPKGSQAKARAAGVRTPWTSTNASSPPNGGNKKRREATYFVLDDDEHGRDYGDDVTCYVTPEAPAEAATPEDPPATTDLDGGLRCPTCGRNVVPRQNSYNGSWVFGCISFPDCRATRSYCEGKAMLAATSPPPAST